MSSQRLRQQDSQQDAGAYSPAYTDALTPTGGRMGESASPMHTRMSNNFTFNYPQGEDVDAGHDPLASGQKRRWTTRVYGFLSIREGTLFRRNLGIQIAAFCGLLIGFICAVAISDTSYAPGIVFGAAVSTACVLPVLLIYCGNPRLQKGPNPFIFYRAALDFVLAFVLIVFQRNVSVTQSYLGPFNVNGVSASRNSSSGCTLVAAVIQFCVLSAECWSSCLIFELFLSLRNPFARAKDNAFYYHCLSWGFPAFTAMIMASVPGLAGKSAIGICWVRFNPSQEDQYFLRASLFLYLWIALVLAGSLMIALHAAYKLKVVSMEVSAVRLQILRAERLYIIVYAMYWLVVLLTYIAMLIGGADRNREALDRAFTFFVAGKGYSDLLMWFAMNDFQPSDIVGFLYTQKNASELDVAPTLTDPLRQEVIDLIREAVCRCFASTEGLPGVQKAEMAGHLSPHAPNLGGVFPSLSSQGKKLRLFEEHKVEVFARIREVLKISAESVARSLSYTAKERVNEGGSGDVEFYSRDGHLIVKSVKKSEFEVLCSMADAYCKHLETNPETLLTKFCGVFKAVIYSQTLYLVVMLNVFRKAKHVRFRYDIKGSWVNRSKTMPRIGDKANCKHCHLSYIVRQPLGRTYLNDCPEHAHGHEPDVVMKDMDLIERLHVSPVSSYRIQSQINQDTAFLCRMDIMNYSLQIGVQEAEFFVDPRQSRMVDMLPASPAKPTNDRIFSVDYHDTSFSFLNSAHFNPVTAKPTGSTSPSELPYTRLPQTVSAAATDRISDAPLPALIPIGVTGNKSPTSDISSFKIPLPSPAAGAAASTSAILRGGILGPAAPPSPSKSTFPASTYVARGRSVDFRLGSTGTMPLTVYSAGILGANVPGPLDIPVGPSASPSRQRSIDRATGLRSRQTSVSHKDKNRLATPSARMIAEAAAAALEASEDGGMFEDDVGPYRCHAKANQIVGAESYHLAIVNILQRWTMQKQAERMFKVYVQRLDSYGISAMPPTPYYERFQDRVKDLLDIR